MPDTCSHGYDQPLVTGDPAEPDTWVRNHDTCPTSCANCGHPCHWHVGQACDAGGNNQCIHPGCQDQPTRCLGWVEP